MRTGPLLLAAAAAAAAALLLALALAGCVPTAPHPSASPSASVAPVFASDAEALAAAEKAYAAYLKVSDQIANDGGKDPDRIAAVSSRGLTEDDLKGFVSFADKGWHSIGQSKVTTFKLQSANSDPFGTGQDAVTAYVCEDLSGVDVVNSTGKSVVAPSRPNLQQFEVSFDLQKSVLIPSDRVPWTGSDLCE